MSRGQFDRLITVQRAAMTTDDYGGETPTWADTEKAWARVKFGTAQEKREAAQESAQQAATFECFRTTALDNTTERDRILFDGDAWDVTGIPEKLDRRKIRFTATRAR